MREMIVARSVVKLDMKNQLKMVDTYEFDDGKMKRITTWHGKERVERQELEPVEIGECEFCDLLGALNRCFGFDAFVEI